VVARRSGGGVASPRRHAAGSAGAPIAVTGERPGSKLAATIAGRIANEIITGRFPAGEVLGSEPELIERYDVSRSVFREAVRLLEHIGAARMRRGPGGGLVVTEPSVDAVLTVALLYIHRVGATADEVFETRLILEEAVAELAPARLDEDGLRQVRALVADEASGRVDDWRAMHALLASLTRNPALELFVEILARVMTLYAPDIDAIPKQSQRAAIHAHERIAAAVISGDDAIARRRMRSHLEAEVAFLRRRRSTRQILDVERALVGPLGSKRAERLARDILRKIVAGGLPPGTALGSEPELLAEHGASRAVFREAVRILEHHHIATMRRGRGGGLFVTEPNVAAVSDAIAVFLARSGVTVEHIAELRLHIELAAVVRAVDQLDERSAAELTKVVDRERVVPADELADRIHDLHGTIGDVAGNRVLELVLLVLVRVTRLYQSEALSSRARRDIRDEIQRAHAGIVEAVVARDRPLAQQRMRRHLDAIAAAL